MHFRRYMNTFSIGHLWMSSLMTKNDHEMCIQVTGNINATHRREISYVSLFVAVRRMLLTGETQTQQAFIAALQPHYRRQMVGEIKAAHTATGELSHLLFLSLSLFQSPFLLPHAQECSYNTPRHSTLRD